jgi:hypothetical protein
MPRVGKIGRFFIEVQTVITSFFERGIDPTSDQIQVAVYGSKYNSDSVSQRDTVYGCIIRGRENVIKMWDGYVRGDFGKDVAYIEYYEPDAWKKQVGSDDFTQFHLSLHDGRFGKDTEELKKNLGSFPAVATVFERKMREYSKAGNNFIIASYGNNSKWFIPSWWIWNIRDYNLYKRSLKILIRQLDRGIKTKVLLPSGQPIAKALDYETVIRAALEDRTVWTCPKCTARNLGTTINCAVCGTAKP